MKPSHITRICTTLAVTALVAAPAAISATETAKEKPNPKQISQAMEKHHRGAKSLSLEQDDLSADVQDLIDEQTDPEVVKLLSEIEIPMAEATDLLEQTNTDGSTIAVETEVIEKIFEAAKKKQQKSGGT